MIYKHSENRFHPHFVSAMHQNYVVSSETVFPSYMYLAMSQEWIHQSNAKCAVLTCSQVYNVCQWVCIKLFSIYWLFLSFIYLLPLQLVGQFIIFMSNFSFPLLVTKATNVIFFLLCFIMCSTMHVYSRI